MLVYSTQYYSPLSASGRGRKKRDEKENFRGKEGKRKKK